MTAKRAYRGGGRERVSPGQDTARMTMRMGADLKAVLMAHTTPAERIDALYKLARKNYDKVRGDHIQPRGRNPV